MNIKYYFCIENQLFNIDFHGGEINDRYVQIDKETYELFLSKVNEGCLVLSIEAKTFTTPKPSHTHYWNGDEWLDSRTPEQIKNSVLKALMSITRRQLRMVLVLNHFDLDVIKAKVLAIEDTQTRQLTLIEWEDASTFERTSSSLLMMAKLLELNDDQVDIMWEQALKL